MPITTTTPAVLTPTAAPATATPAATASTQPATNGNEDRFLKLLVAQIANQDPLNPMDNAQVTSQMAQIQTVTGIEKLNTTFVGLTNQFTQMQAMSGVSLVGRGVVVEGNRMQVADGQGHAGFELSTQTDEVKVEVLNSAGRVIDAVNLGALPSGRHAIEWTPPQGVDANQASRFRITATRGAAVVDAVPLNHDRVAAVATGNNGLTLELESGGLVPYDQVRVFEQALATGSAQNK